MKGLVARGLPLLAVAVLVVNDHVLKQHCPGIVTGKLSDFAGLFFFPLLLTDALAAMRPGVVERRRLLAGACVATVLVFALVKTWGLAHDAYSVGLGAFQWPFRAAAALVRSGSLPLLRRVRMTMDPTDLVALIAVLASYRYACARSSDPRSPGGLESGRRAGGDVAHG
jgi:hypothetical protein